LGPDPSSRAIFRAIRVKHQVTRTFSSHFAHHQPGPVRRTWGDRVQTPRGVVVAPSPKVK
jgi:hypothetical protein